VQTWWFELFLPRIGLAGLASRGRAARLRRIAQRFHALAVDLGGLMIKVGQFMSSRLDVLPPEITKELEGLQDEVPPVPFDAIRTLAEAELGVPLERAYSWVDPTPLAAASLGQAHRATLSDADAEDTGLRDVVIKIQRPGIDQIVEVDLRALRRVGGWLSRIRLVSDRVDAPALVEEFAATSLEEIDYLHEAANAERFAQEFAGDARVSVPDIVWERTTRRVLTLEDVTAIKINDVDGLRAAGIDPAEVAIAFASVMFDQLFKDGFFHADPHPGNLMWWNDRIYFLDFGMVGEVDPEMREQLMLLLMAFWQEDVGFLTDVTLMMSGAIDRNDLDVDAFRGEIGQLMGTYRTASLAEIQLGPVLQEMTEVSLRHGVPLPASLTLTGKALAQMQLATAALDPELDPFDVAGGFLMRSVFKEMGGKFDLKAIFYQTQKFKVRALRVVEAVERLIGARPGQKLEVNFRAATLEETIRRAGRRLALGLIAGAAVLASGLTGVSERVAPWVPITFGVVGGVLTIAIVIDIIRKR
jgi:predicted unusual protein kinase regulating ubiquinone biosynthesis (AarF/ABC1/UbiB family)